MTMIEMPHSFVMQTDLEPQLELLPGILGKLLILTMFFFLHLYKGIPIFTLN